MAKTQQRPGAEPEATDAIEGMAKVTLLLGSDTLERLDKIVKRGRFGGRGRALDALLDSLEDCVDEIGSWGDAFDQLVNRKSDSATKAQAESEMLMHTMKVWGNLERFFDLESED
jgi:hypothetical protein